MLSKRLIILAQCAISIVLVWYLLSRVDFSNVLRSVQKLNPLWLLASFAQLLAQPLLGAWRWKVIVAAFDGSLGFAAGLRFYWIGAFFSQALPGAVGGDAVRMWLFWQAGGDRRVAFSSVVLERIVMVLSLLLVVAVTQPLLVARSGSAVATWLPPLMLLAAVSGLAVLMLSDRFISRFNHFLPVKAISYLAADARKIILEPAVMGKVTFISILSYLNMAVSAWLIALALSLPVSLLDCITLIPVAVLAAMMPISLGGWGVREGVMVVLFGLVGVSSTDALTLSVLFGIVCILIGLPGVAIWISGGHRRSELQEAAALAAGEVQKG